MTVFDPYHISEREAGGWEDCVPASCVMFENGLRGADIHPPTRLEYEAFRKAATGVAEGNGKGMHLSGADGAEQGFKVRYERTNFTIGDTFDQLLRMPVGTYAVMQGLAGALPGSLQYGFKGAHCTLWIRDREASALWKDPLRANGSPSLRITNDQARAYFEALGGAEWLAGPWREGHMAIDSRPQLGDVRKGVPFYEAPGDTLPAGEMSIDQTIEIVGVPTDGSADHLNLGWRAVWVTTSKITGTSSRKIVYVALTAIANLRAIPAPPVGGTDPAALAKAKLEGRNEEWERWASAEAARFPSKPPSP